VNVEIVVFDGLDELDALGPHEVFSTARKLGAPVDHALVSVGRPEPVTGQHGLTFAPSRQWTPTSADIVVVPGGGWVGAGQPGVRAVIADGGLPARLGAEVRDGLTLASVCTGAMILAAAGITKGRPCTTNRFARDDLRAGGGKLVDARVVDDGDLVTSGGVTSGLDLALWLLEREIGAETAIKAEIALDFRRRGTVWRSDSS
jgi:transcriptional regulator GlxA family with amidase domain